MMPQYLRFIYGLIGLKTKTLRQKLAIVSGLANNHLGEQAQKAHYIITTYENINSRQAL